MLIKQETMVVQRELNTITYYNLHNSIVNLQLSSPGICDNDHTQIHVIQYYLTVNR